MSETKRVKVTKEAEDIILSKYGYRVQIPADFVMIVGEGFKETPDNIAQMTLYLNNTINEKDVNLEI